MSAYELTKAPRGRWLGTYGMPPRLAQDDHRRSLSISNEGGALAILRFHADCSQEAVIDALKGLGS